MIFVENFQWIAKYILLSFPYFESVLLATTTETARNSENDGTGHSGKDIYFFSNNKIRYTSPKRYTSNWTAPTVNTTLYGKFDLHHGLVMYVAIMLFLIIILIFLALICKKNLTGKNCCSTESDSHSSNAFSAVHRAPEREGFAEELQRPTTRRNPLPVTRRELLGPPGRTDLFYELDNNGNAADPTRLVNTFIGSSDLRSPQGRRETYNDVKENPPMYSAVILSDLVNPNEPMFPVVKKVNETPPPEYGKQKSFFK